MSLSSEEDAMNTFVHHYNHPRVNWNNFYNIYGNWLTDKGARGGIVQWQIDDWMFIDEQIECCILRSRKASKTYDLVNWLFMRVTATGEKWAWLSSQMGQLNEAYLAMTQHPWFKCKTWILKKQYIELIDGSKFVFGHISLGQLGLGLDGLIIDEEQSMEKKQAEEVYPQMRPMMAISGGKIIHTGTRWIDTPFDYNVDHLPTSTHDWTMCPWLFKNGSPDTFIAREIASGIRPDWEIDLLYRCIPTLPGGKVFPNIVLWSGPMPDCYPITQGVDFNALPGHTFEQLGRFVDGLIALKEEIYLYKRDDDLLQEACLEYPTEVEAGGWNDVYAPNMYGVTKVPFTEGKKDKVDPKGKPERIRRLLMQPWFINPDVTPGLYDDVRKARYGADGKVDTGDLHFLAAAMHAITADMKVYHPTASQPTSYGVGMDEVRLRAKLSRK